MASWESRSWPVRRWLADRLIGDHGYSKNVAPAPVEWITSPPFQTRTAIQYWEPAPVYNGLVDFVQTNVKPFNQETA